MSTARETASSILPDASAWRITYGEIAALAQVRRPVPTTWSRRHADFPAPVAHDADRPLFDAHAVVDWLTTTGHGNADPRHLRAELALHSLAAQRTPALPGPVLVGALTALLCLRQQLDAPVAEGGWSEVMDRAADLDPDDTFLVAELRAVPDPDSTGRLLAALADELTEAAYTPAEAFDWVLEARRRLGSQELAIDEPTPAVVQALAAFSGVAALADGSVVAVPHVCSGDLLAALSSHAAEDSGHTYLACDLDPAHGRLVRRRMLVRGVYEFRLDVAEGEDLAVDDWGDPDLLVCALPYEPAESRNTQATLERLEALTDYLRDGSTAVVLGPADALVHALPRPLRADRLRRSFLENGLLKAVVALPDGAFAYRPGYRTAVWVLARQPKDERAGHILLSDFSAQPLTEPALASLTDDIAVWRASGWFGDRRHEYRHGVVVPARYLYDQPGAAFATQGRSADAHWTRTVRERPVHISMLEQRLSDLHEQARDHIDVRAAVKVQAVLRSEDAQPVRHTRIRRLLDDRRLSRRPGHRIGTEHITSDGHYAVLSPDEVLGTAVIGSRRIDRGLLLTAYEHVQFTERGDVVVTASPRFGAYVDEEGWSVVAAPCRILRVRHDAEPPLRPRVLAALLRAAAAGHERADGAVRASRRVEDLLIPELSLDEAERYDAVLAEITSRAAVLRQQSVALDDLARLTAAGLADGTLTLQSLPDTDD